MKFVDHAGLDVKERAWIANYGDHARVVVWLEKNPPPPEFTGTRAQWAFLEMPLPPGDVHGDLVFSGLGVAAL